jgi:NADH:ubiquinone oxidoreductase subunit 6 (subunit J)
VATRFQLLPEVVDVTTVFTMAGGVGILCTIVGASLQHPAERLARLALLGQTVGAFLGAIILVAGLVTS